MKRQISLCFAIIFCLTIIISSKPSSAQNHPCSMPTTTSEWRIAIYIITDATWLLSRPTLHEDIVFHNTIDTDYIPEIKERAERFATALSTMSHDNMSANLSFYVCHEPITILMDYTNELRDFYADEELFTLIADTTYYDYIMIVHGIVIGGLAGMYLQTLDNSTRTHVGVSQFHPGLLDSTFADSPNDTNTGELPPVEMFGVEWDFFTYLLLHEFLHGMEDQARAIGVEFPLIHNYEGYWHMEYIPAAPGEPSGNFVWSTEHRLPFYYAIMTNSVPRPRHPNPLWGFTPEVFLRTRPPQCVAGEWNVERASCCLEQGEQVRHCVYCEVMLELETLDLAECVFSEYNDTLTCLTCGRIYHGDGLPYNNEDDSDSLWVFVAVGVAILIVAMVTIILGTMRPRKRLKK